MNLRKLNMRWISGAILIAVAAFVIAGESGMGPSTFSSVAREKPSRIVFASPGPLTGAVGTTITNTASIRRGNARIRYASSNPAIATVNPETGVASLLAVGSSTISAYKRGVGRNNESASYVLNVTPGTQAIAFVQTGLNVLLGSESSNTASGGNGTGAISYSSSNLNAVSVDATSGTVTANGVGSAIITATKAADANYLQTQATYIVNSQTANKVSAFIGANGTEVNLPASANGKQFVRARVSDCLATDVLTTCAGNKVDAVNGASISDDRATLTTPALYAISNGSIGKAVDVREGRFSNRIGHAVTYFKSRYWVIGGGEFVIPSGVPLNYAAKADVWSSADGKAWKLETADGGFGARWLHHAVAYNNRIWIFSGSATPASPLPWYSDVWSSADGVNWTQETSNAGFSWWSNDLNIVVFNNEMLAVSGGRVYSSTNGVFALKSSTIPALTGSTLGRTDASLTIYNNQLWYIGGKVDYPINQPQIGDATNDVWKSSDGITWTQVIANGAAPFAPRYRHTSFVANGRLWIMGGQGYMYGVEGTYVADAWSTTDGVTWAKENVNALARSYAGKIVQELNKVTLIAGIQYAFANNVWQTVDGANWSELSTNAQFSARTTRAVDFKGHMWVVGGTSSSGNVNDFTSNDVWRSSDGVNWARVATSGPIFSPRDGHGLVVFNNRLWVIGGNNNPTGTNGVLALNDIWSSADGVTWLQESNAAGFQPRANHAVSNMNGKLYLIGGYSSSAYFGDVWSSTDGANWSLETSLTPFGSRTGHQVAVFNNALWLIDGENGSYVNDDIWRSTDGITWAQQTVGPHFSARKQFQTAVVNNRLYVIGGIASSNFLTAPRFNDVWSTADGMTWTQDTANGGFSPRYNHTVLTHNNELWLIGGFNVGPFNDVWRSSDGVNWQVGYSNDIQVP